MKQRKNLSLFITVLLIFCLTGCGEESKDQSVAESVTAPLAFPSEETAVSGSGDNGPDSGIGESAAGNQENADADSESIGHSNILIAYFSISEDVETTDAVAGASVVIRGNEKLGNTEYVAKIIQQTIGGDLFRIETVEEYPLDHDPLVDQAAEEQDEDKHPELLNHVENFEQYETIILGFPKMEQGFESVLCV